MVLVKRHITPPPFTCDVPNDRFTILMDITHSNTVGLLAQISQLFTLTNEMFSELAQEASATGKRIQNLKSRVVKLKSSLLTADACVDQGVDLVTPGTQFSNKCPEQAQLYMYEDRVPAMVYQYNNCAPPPKFEILDQYAGETCLKKYSNRDFFLETWLEEERLKYEDAKKKRAERRQNRQSKPTLVNQRKVVKHVELSRAKYSAMGKEFSDVEPKNTLTLTSFLSSTPSNNIPTLSPRQNPPSRSPRAQEKSPNLSIPQNTPPPPQPANITPPQPSHAPPTSQIDSPTTSGEIPTAEKKTRSKDKEKDREKKKKSKKEKTGEKEKKSKRKIKPADIPPPNYEPPPVPSDLPPSVPSNPPVAEEKAAPQVVIVMSPPVPPPQPLSPKKPSQPSLPSSPPAVQQPPILSSPSLPQPSQHVLPQPSQPILPQPSQSSLQASQNAPVPPSPMAPVPPPPPAPVMGGGHGSLASSILHAGQNLHASKPVEKPVEKRSNLLASIQKGVALKKVQQVEKKVEESKGVGAFNIAKILERRAAMEYSDSEDDNDEEWDD